MKCGKMQQGLSACFPKLKAIFTGNWLTGTLANSEEFAEIKLPLWIERHHNLEILTFDSFKYINIFDSMNRVNTTLRKRCL